MSGMIGKAMAGAAGAVKEVSLEYMRADIMATRDKRLNDYARSMKTEVDQPFQAGENEKTRTQDYTKHSETLGETKRHNQATESNQRKLVDGKLKGAGGTGLKAKDAIVHVLQPRYGGKLEGGMWFPDEANKDVALRANQLLEQFSSNGVPPMEAAVQAVEKAEREKAAGTLPIGKAPKKAAESTSPASDAGGKSKSFRHLYMSQPSVDEDEDD
jgi:DNA-directed RNA polymerase subunit K/omega